MTFSAFTAYAAVVGISADVVPEAQNSDYESGLVDIAGRRWHIRTARVTPTKPGAFVAFWTRAEDGSTRPFKSADVGAGLLVFVVDGGRRGVFRFTSDHLAELGVTSGPRAGKRGFRVYPRWCDALNRQAAAAQRAQARAFEEF